MKNSSAARPFSALRVQRSTLDADEASLSSTLTANRGVLKEPQKIEQPPRRELPRADRLVQFNEARNEYHFVSSSAYKNEFSSRWYNSHEMQEMRANHLWAFRSICKDEFYESDDSFVSVLKQVYLHCCQGSIAPFLTEQEMRKELKENPLRHGLEQSVIRSAVCGKRCRRQTLWEIVRNLPKSCSSLEQYDLDEVVREKCMEVSRPARMFALSIGQAHQDQN